MSNIVSVENPFGVPSIFIIDEAALEAGQSRGLWIDVTMGENWIDSEIAEFLDESPVDGADSYFIHDQGEFEGVTIKRNEAIESISKKAKIVSEHGRLGAMILQNHHGHADEALNTLTNIAANMPPKLILLSNTPETNLNFPDML